MRTIPKPAAAALIATLIFAFGASCGALMGQASNPSLPTPTVTATTTTFVKIAQSEPDLDYQVVAHACIRIIDLLIEDATNLSKAMIYTLDTGRPPNTSKLDATTARMKAATWAKETCNLARDD